jgi:hypothetical protein
MGISGYWYNELNSQMELTQSGGDVWGTYYTAVGTASGLYTLTGQVDANPYSYSQALGWAVAWNSAYVNAHSATAWSGQYQTIGGKEEIVAFWLLTSEQIEENDWEATLVGKDVFTRDPPSPEDVEKARVKIAKSHPAAAKPESADTE